MNEILYFCGRRGVWLSSNRESTMVWNSRTILSQPNCGKSQGISVPLHTENTNAVGVFCPRKIRNFSGTLCHEERGQSERKEHRRRNIEKPVLKSLIGITGQSPPGKCKRLFRKRKEFQKKQKLIPWKIAFTYVYRQCHT